MKNRTHRILSGLAITAMSLFFFALGVGAAWYTAGESEMAYAQHGDQ